MRPKTKAAEQDLIERYGEYILDSSVGDCTRHPDNVDKHLVSQMTVETTHDTAIFWLEQLLENDITEEAILAHLTRRKFGGAHPNDYLEHTAR